MRRMNHIVEINETSMYAVVEPYVIGAELQAELMKRGLNANLIGAGSNCSAHPLIGHVGGGHMGQTTSYAERCLLGVEWVTPDGEIAKLGSLGSVDEWFCGDGPGPSLRGVIRGISVPCGGLGVFTKAAAKLYHWPGPSRFPVDGVSPNYAPERLPTNFLIRYLFFPSYDAMIEAQRKIGESEISFELMAFHIAQLASNIATSNEDEIVLRDRLKDEAKGPGFVVILAGLSSEDLDYKREVLDMITEETQGQSLKCVEDDKVGGALLWRCIRITGSIRECFRATGVFGGAQGDNEFLGTMFDYIRKVGVYKDEIAKQGLVYDDEAPAMGWSIEHGHLGHAEMLIRYKPERGMANPAKLILDKSNDIALAGHYGVPHSTVGDEMHDLFGPHAFNYHSWLRKIKGSFDPKGLSDSLGYITAGKDEEG
jgi:glycolate oxidase